ncbi:MAG TPA: TspO/MBR family protein [Patescibacteria group bacterium]|jgi:tryptophan-rich sensory protein|nr:TspO/MBR family protein [Patescibacteria group bacterium]
MTTYAWYKKLKKPSFAPPPWVFTPVWSVLYIMIFFTFGYVMLQWISGTLPFLLILPFVVNLISNLAYTPIQFGLKNNEAALVDIFVIDVTLLWAMIGIYQYYPFVTYILIPYLLWILFATILQSTITYLNRKK